MITAWPVTCEIVAAGFAALFNLSPDPQAPDLLWPSPLGVFRFAVNGYVSVALWSFCCCSFVVLCLAIAASRDQASAATKCNRASGEPKRCRRDSDKRSVDSRAASGCVCSGPMNPCGTSRRNCWRDRRGNASDRFAAFVRLLDVDSS